MHQGRKTIVDLPIFALTKTFSFLGDVEREQFVKSQVLPEVVRFISRPPMEDGADVSFRCSRFWPRR